MASREDLTKRVPSLAEWLGDDVRGDGFETWVSESLGLRGEDMTADENLWIRLAQTFGVACVEQMNREAARDPSPEHVARALSMWSRVAGYVTIMAVASVAKDDAPFRGLARTFAEDFKIGSKMGADALLTKGASHG